MKSREFAFWLQGYFELEETTKGLDFSQLQQVRTKIASVEAAPGDQVGAFVEYTRGALDTFVMLPLVHQQENLERLTQQLRTKINEVFLHVIDPTIEGDQSVLRRQHRPGGDDGKPGIVAMC